MTDFAVLIVAGGTGIRAGEGLPKQYRNLGGKALLRRTIEVFLGLTEARNIRVVIHPHHKDFYLSATEGLNLPDPVIGGNSRRESVSKGLQAFAGLPPETPLLIHDAARPFVSTEIIKSCLEKLKTAQAVTTAIPVSDTLRKGVVDTLGEAVDRDGLWSIQTPQGFRYATILKAHETLEGDFTDDSQMVSAMGIDVEIVQGSRKNIKLTTEDDFKMFQNTKITKTGLGYDVHAFDTVEASSIRIGGLDITHPRKLLGHSDADVVLHAITDAIYGTIADGDIGSHFPPSNNEFKNMDSSIFLKEAVKSLTQAGGRIVHIDTVIICEEPKIGPHRDKIRESIANICALPLKSCSVKATTSEGLGFTGRREGIACQALVTIEIEE